MRYVPIFSNRFIRAVSAGSVTHVESHIVWMDNELVESNPAMALLQDTIMLLLSRIGVVHPAGMLWPTALCDSARRSSTKNNMIRCPCVRVQHITRLSTYRHAKKERAEYVSPSAE